MPKNSCLNHKSPYSTGSIRRRAALAGIIVAMVSCIIYVSPVAERLSLASGTSRLIKDPARPLRDPVTASLNPVQTQCSTSTAKSVVGEFGPVIKLPQVPVHLSVLPNKKVLFWGRDKTGTAEDPKEAVGRSNTYLWDPSSVSTLADGTLQGNTSTITNFTTNLFCSGHSFLPDGRLLVTGGHRSPDFDGAGERHTNVFDYRTNGWLRAPDMNLGRWYPYNVTLGTGESLTMSGSYFQAMSGRAMGSRSFSQLSRLFDTNAGKGAGSWMNVGNTLFIHEIGTSVLYDSNGKVLLTGGFTTGTLDPSNTTEVIDLSVNDPATGFPTWRQVPSMNYPRVYHTATILPNGKVLVTGGTTCTGRNNVDCTSDPLTAAATTAEMWDPTGSPSPDPSTVPWCKMAKQKEVRAYHSIAALLPDGKVLVGGGGLPGAVGEIDANGVRITDVDLAHAKIFGHKNVEIYSPPYLFDSMGNNAVRPSITSPPPPSITYGQTFSIGVSGAGPTPKVSLVRLASVTHGFNQDQRIIFLNHTLNGSTGLNLVAPPDANKCPPGYYMLFVINSSGVPSISEIVRVGQDDGYLDAVNGGQVWGWAWDRNMPSTPISVDIYEADTFVARVEANQFRQDLLNAGKGNGYHGFFYNIPPAMWKDGNVHQINVRFANSSSNLPTNNLGSSPRSIAVASMFPVPAGSITSGSGGGQTWEQAIQFSSSLSGKITHLRYYKAPGETGSHIGRLWSDTGTLLTQVMFQNETASGWQTQALPTPYHITAGVRYRVSYNVNTFGTKIPGAFGPAITNGPLTAWTGVYTTPAGTFPNTGSVSNFLADVIFEMPR